MKALIIDIETNSATPATADILEVGWVLYDLKARGMVDCGSRVFDNGGDVGPVHVHGLHPDILRGALECAHRGEERNRGPKEYAKFIAYDYCPDILIAHFAEFESTALGDITKDNGEVIPWVCSWKDIEWPAGERKRLVDLALCNSVGVVAAHRAIADCLTLSRVLDATGSRGHDLCNLMELAQRPRAVMSALTGGRDQEFSEKLRDAGFRRYPTDEGFYRWQREVRAETFEAWIQKFPELLVWSSAQPTLFIEAAGLPFHRKDEAKSRDFKWVGDEKRWVLEVPAPLDEGAAAKFVEALPFRWSVVRPHLAADLRNGVYAGG